MVHGAAVRQGNLLAGQGKTLHQPDFLPHDTTVFFEQRLVYLKVTQELQYFGRNAFSSR